MSTFGEIIEPASRAEWEDWDENNQENVNSQLHWQNDIEVPKQINTLLILEGRYLSDCIKREAEFQLELINLVPNVNLQLYKTRDSDNYICIFKEYNLVQSSEIVELLKQYITLSNDVVAILTKPLVEYQISDLSAQECIIRSLFTHKPVSPSLNINFPKLEQPNIISGVSAGVICLREILDLPAVAVVCYTEHPEEYPINELHKLLMKLNIVSLQSKPNNVLNSNLYI